MSSLADLKRCPFCHSADIIDNGHPTFPWRCVPCAKVFITPYVISDAVATNSATPQNLQAAAAGQKQRESDQPTEGHCERCRREYPVWCAPNEIWNRVVRDEHFLCMDCFARLAEERGLKPTAWIVNPESDQPEQVIAARMDEHARSCVYCHLGNFSGCDRGRELAALSPQPASKEQGTT